MQAQELSLYMFCDFSGMLGILWRVLPFGTLQWKHTSMESEDLSKVKQQAKRLLMSYGRISGHTNTTAPLSSQAALQR